ncbi:MAG: hypothetical protein ACTSRG_17905 [Candidatus Helarchaeota archaeon]
MTNVNILNEEYIRKIISDANLLFSKYDLDKDIIPVALDIIIRYIHSSIPAEPREKDILYAAAFFIAIRHPFSHPSSVTRDSLAEKFGIKTTSLDWYINKILTELEFLRVHDEKSIPYFIDRNSLIFTVTISIIHSQLSESLLKAIISNKVPDINSVVDKIINILIDRLRILPSIFKRSLRSIVLDMIRQEIKELKI